MKRSLLLAVLAVGWLLVGGSPRAQDYKSTLPANDPAIQYHRPPFDDAAARLARAMEHGDVVLDRREGPLGVLPALLDTLHVPVDSQMLVFSKTSVQAPRVSPEQPRAIYFGDNVAVAYVPGAPTIEIAATDPARGSVFYTMPIAGGGPPAASGGGTCLRCHHGPNTAGVPGIYVGSVIPGPTGAPLRDTSAIVTDHRTPFADRWGGWYVTAARGEQADRANATAPSPADPSALTREARQNLPNLLGLFDGAPYLAGSSDIVALMTFEHQTQATNLLTRVGWEARMAASGDTNATLDADVEDLVAYLLFAGEAPVAAPVEGTSSFARTFAARNPRDRRGRSLRDFDLRTRLFKYRLSYVVYGAAFDGLPDLVKRRVYARLREILTAGDPGPRYRYLPQEERRAIVEILRDTKRGLPGDWSSER